jgi:protein arginine kinase
MKLSDLTSQAGEWLRGSGPMSEIVISSRIRLARNVAGFPFLTRCSKSARKSLEEKIRDTILESKFSSSKTFYVDLESAPDIDRQLLVERHLISRPHATAEGARGVAVGENETLAIMVNEEDHLRMQVLRSGLQLDEAWEQITAADDKLEARLDFAFHPSFGYLTACPTNVGTGMRASAMVHLPALVLSEQINQIIQAVNKIGLAVRGLYGEGTEAMGNLFQVSNQTTLGEKEDEIITRLNQVIEKIIEHEQNARQLLLQKRLGTLLDQVGRAFGVLTHAHSMTSKEALNLLSFMKLGIDLGFFPDGHRPVIDELFMETQPAHLQKSSQQKLQVEERDALRAGIIREKLKQFPEPDIGHTPETGNGNSEKTDDE